MRTINKKAFIKNTFFAAGIWFLGVCLTTVWGAAWAAATKQPWMISAWLVIYLVSTLLFAAWVVKGWLTDPPANGKHHPREEANR